MKNRIQEAFENQILNWLSNRELRALISREERKTLAETSFDLLIRWYPQISSDGRDSYGLDIIGRLENAKVSMRAKILIEQICNEFIGSKNELKKELKRVLHYEHNVPVDVIKKRLIQLETINIETIKTLLSNDYSIVLITKAEEQSLRENGYTSRGEYQERLDAISTILIDEETKSELIQTIKNRLNQLP